MTTTTQGMIRGYSLKQTAKYLEAKFDAEVRRRSLESLPAVLRSQINSIEPGEWYPRDYSVALYRAIAAAKNDGAGTYQDLVNCGEYIASEATNTFLKLLMRIMSPTLFAKKIPEFWKRDQKGGYFEADVSKADDSLIKMRLVDVEGYDHIGIVSIGWIQFGMTALGKKGVNVKQTGWTMERPGPREVEYEVTWS